MTEKTAAAPLETDALWNLIDRAESGDLTPQEARVLRRCVQVIVDRAQKAEARVRELEAELDEVRELVQTQARACLDHHEPIAAQRNAAEARVAELEQQVCLASEFRVPCPQPDPRAHSDVLAHRKPDDLLVRRRTDGQGDGWLILNPNRQPGDHVWTGSEWVYRGELHRDVIYKWDLDEALEVAPELAEQETAQFEAWVEQMRQKRGQQ